MKRIEQWQRSFSDFLDQHRQKPFKWGENDCVYFVSKSVKSLTGEDHHTQYVYEDKDGAEQILKDNHGIIGLLTKHFGIPHKNKWLAKRGDVVIVKIPEITAGVVDDTGQNIVSVSENGIVRLPLSAACRVWSIG